MLAAHVVDESAAAACAGRDVNIDSGAGEQPDRRVVDLGPQDLLGAAGAVEGIFSVLAIRDGVAPPTLNLEKPSRESIIDRVAKEAQQRSIKVALSNSFGFGGTNAAVIFSKVA
jgi:hypothetical protein